jgi:opacity protein-like surface antigen
MKQLALLAVAGSLAILAAPAQAADLPVAAPAFATAHHASLPVAATHAYGRSGWDRDDWRGRDDRRWDDGRRLGQRDRVWRGDDGRYRCRRDDGTVGLVIGAGVGALLGREIDRRGDRTLGTILGAVGGGLLGREIDRGDIRCR